MKKLQKFKHQIGQVDCSLNTSEIVQNLEELGFDVTLTEDEIIFSHPKGHLVFASGRRDNEEPWKKEVIIKIKHYLKRIGKL